MGLKPNGFAANKGLTDKTIENVHGFFWYFDDKKSRDEAERQVIEMIKSAHARNIGIQSSMRKTKAKGSFYRRVLVPLTPKRTIVTHH